MAITSSLRGAILAKGWDPERWLFPAYMSLSGNTATDIESGKTTAQVMEAIERAGAADYVYNQIVYRGVCTNMEREATANYAFFNTSCADESTLPTEAWPAFKYLFLSAGGKNKDESAYEGRSYSGPLTVPALAFTTAPVHSSHGRVCTVCGTGPTGSCS